jgi:hypothetical protein
MKGLDVPSFTLRPQRSCLFKAGFCVLWHIKPAIRRLNKCYDTIADGEIGKILIFSFEKD